MVNKWVNKWININKWIPIQMVQGRNRQTGTRQEQACLRGSTTEIQGRRQTYLSPAIGKITRLYYSVEGMENVLWFWSCKYTKSMAVYWGLLSIRDIYLIGPSIEHCCRSWKEYRKHKQLCGGAMMTAAGLKLLNTISSMSIQLKDRSYHVFSRMEGCLQMLTTEYGRGQRVRLVITLFLNFSHKLNVLRLIFKFHKCVWLKTVI